ncbi:MAG: 6-carboxyhexanoate--CoA ligase [Leptospirales bacterium]
MNKEEQPVLYSLRMRAFNGQKHLSGGEDIVDNVALKTRLLELLDQGLEPSSKQLIDPPHSINIRIDPVHTKDIKTISLLPVYCLKTKRLEETWFFLKKAFEGMGEVFGISGTLGYQQAEKLLSDKNDATTGASLLLPNAESRIPNGDGIRITHFGINPSLKDELTQESAIHALGSGRRFIEALQISSKILSHEKTAFELCLSDNPEYTTGYLSVRGVGYIRLPFVKPPGLRAGGRIIGVLNTFIESDMLEMVGYLTESPVLFTSRNPLYPPEDLEDILKRVLTQNG